ncbi:hypothetical protein [Erysipelothrix aquatica]|uniref:hypothetical protein n=1 Tax=Erysipelothrix aquatica TaxID=2683714 RepID=UPI0013582C75|nr:hypothetical protein [Erysipelothrix aquatica]
MKYKIKEVLIYSLFYFFLILFSYDEKLMIDYTALKSNIYLFVIFCILASQNSTRVDNQMKVIRFSRIESSRVFSILEDSLSNVIFSVSIMAVWFAIDSLFNIRQPAISYMLNAINNVVLLTLLNAIFINLKVKFNISKLFIYVLGSIFYGILKTGRFSLIGTTIIFMSSMSYIQYFIALAIHVALILILWVIYLKGNNSYEIQ